MKVEEKALVLDYLARGRSSDYKTEPIAQLIGTEYFTLLEVVPKENAGLKSLEEVYVGKDERPKIDFIKKRIPYKDLTNTALAELDNAIEKIVSGSEKKYVDFFNNSRSITLKRHQIELLPGMGKKHMLQVIEEREKGAFDSFEDIKKRVHSVPDPKHALVKRIVEELEGMDVKYYLFVRPPSQERDFRPRRRF
ncbi:MAG: DNA-binding protein [Candidatus Diapherotrites archaeon]|uniref:DNA-binding protein n=1 Tax=Candidatus Iainarchaeum sp. TaxID=3101447 RepID=A0A2D6LPQ7_9ARCH|nr:DNA-binding protein [Candidatus Diapherotrites archaeon]|tara:strand:+ start:617 stop:1198 length:582 start_codon:yes stop_codon:yes gene_type:complete